MKTLFVLFALVAASLALTKLPTQPSPHKLNLIRQELNRVGEFVSKGRALSQKHDLGDMSILCGLCGIAVNEIEGFMAENLTETEIQSLISSQICTSLSGLYQMVCNQVVAEVPSIVASIENKDTVSVVCVSRGYCTKPFSSHTDPQPLAEVVIDLDLPPNQRLPNLCSNPLFQNVSQFLVNSAHSLFPIVSPYLEEVGALINNYYFPTEYAQEIQGCASTLGISAGWLALLNIGYEVSDACTSIVAQTTDGKILHGRNLDFWDGMGFTDSLKDLAIMMDYQKGGKTIFKAAGFAGYVGVLSGFKAEMFSATVDTRFYPGGLGDMFYEVIAAITEKNASLVTFLMRKTFTNENDFDAALDNLSNGELIADVYYILAGVSATEGVVISRNRHNASDVWRLNPSAGRWFEVQTNYDHWNAPPWFDDRVVPANDAMENMGQENLSLSGLFNVLSTKPVFNLQTTYSILSCPADGTFQAFARYCPYPCVE